MTMTDDCFDAMCESWQDMSDRARRSLLEEIDPLILSKISSMSISQMVVFDDMHCLPISVRHVIAERFDGRTFHI